MPPNTKRVTLLLLGLTLLSIVLLSSSLSNLRLQPGFPFPEAESHNTIQNSAISQDRSNLPEVLQAILKLVLLLLMIYVPLRWVLQIKLKWFFWVIQLLALLLIVIFALSFIELELTAGVPEIAITVPTVTESSPLGKPPQGFIYFVVIGLALIAALFLAKIFTHRPHPDHSLLTGAETALQAIKAGADFKNVIVRCYLEMADVLQKEYGIERDQHLTPREFEDLLEFQGLPSHSIRELTDLFEKVRYGRQQLGTSDEKKAVESLSAIVRFAKGNP